MIISDLVKIPNTENITTEYIEAKLEKCDIMSPLRWSLVHTNSDSLTISIAYEK